MLDDTLRAIFARWVPVIQLQRFEQWLMFRSRSIFLGLIAVNIVVAVVLIGVRDPVGESVAVERPFESAIQLNLPAVNRSAPLDEPSTECRFWGPEISEEAFNDLRSELESLGGVPQVVKSEVEVEPDYLVSVIGLRSLEQAKQVSRELAALQIESYILRREEEQPALSVGVFSRRDLAQKQQLRVEKLGYQVSLDALVRKQTVFNLWAHVMADTEIYRSSIAPCPSIAHNS